MRISSALETILGLLYPSDAGCAVCGAQHPMARSPLPLCESCFLTIEGRGMLRRSGSCYTYAACKHEGVARKLVIMLKFHDARYLADGMGKYVSRGFALTGREYDFVTGVPLAAERFRERGFNQAALIAKSAGKNANVPMAELLIRVKNTERQTSLGGRKRLANVKNAFTAKAGTDISGKTIMLVDDVYTTGATLRECRQALLDAGAKHVDMLAFSHKELESGEIEGDGFDD